MPNNTIFTIGHSNHAHNHFIKLLQTNSITLIIDVRSQSRSSFAPQFNREALEPFLRDNKIAYQHLPDAFGAKPGNMAMLDADGKVNYDKVRRSTEFLRGITKLRTLEAEGQSIGLMCAEANPIECHRFSMIALGVQDAGFTVKHILRDGSLIENGQLENELLRRFEKKIPRPDMFRPVVTLDEQIRFAYRLYNKAIAKSTLDGQW